MPTAAIQRGAPGTFVYLVKPDHTVAVQKVKLGPGDGQRVVILSGLQPGQMVVDDGADRLKDGAKVTLAAAGATSGSAAGSPAKAPRCRTPAAADRAPRCRHPRCRTARWHSARPAGSQADHRAMTGFAVKLGPHPPCCARHPLPQCGRGDPAPT